jgi:hypothetical protein
MRTLKLELDALQVESFHASPGRAPETGTVRGNGGTCDCSGEEVCTGDETCWGAESCAVTACLTCLCPHTGPQPSCDPCSWDGGWSCDPAGCA